MMMCLINCLFGSTINLDIYAITYGDPKAPYVLEDYFDIGCEHCIEFYRGAFQTIKKRWCKKGGKLRVVFRPYPVHPEMLLFMSCCEGLSPCKRKALFELVMENDEGATTQFIKACMHELKAPHAVQPSTQALSAMMYITNQIKADALPVMFFNKKRLTDSEQDHIIQFLVAAL